VNGLSQKWSDRVIFLDYDVFTPEGAIKERELGLRFHGYAILDASGSLFWNSIGHSVTVEELEKQIEAVLAVQTP